MSITAFTSQPNKLLTSIKSAIDNGKIETWKYDADGDFTHTPDQWNRKAWFRPHIKQDKVVFGLLGTKNTALQTVTYGIYHGHFIAMLLNHFDKNFSSVSATAQKDSFDIF